MFTFRLPERLSVLGVLSLCQSLVLQSNASLLYMLTMLRRFIVQMIPASLECLTRTLSSVYILRPYFDMLLFKRNVWDTKKSP
jgi:hypothetical protein